jgi:hypothetical protein
MSMPFADSSRRTLVKRKLALPLAALLLMFVLVPQAARAQSWNAATDFEKGWTTKSNPNGVWSYGYSWGLNPVTLYNLTGSGFDGSNTQYWYSSSVNDEYSPAVQYNDGAAYNNGSVDFLAHEFVLVAGVGGSYSDLIFTAPASGDYSVVGSFRGAQYDIGTVVAIVANEDILFNSSVTSVNETVPFDTQVTLKKGGTIVFSAGPGGGLQNTGLAVTITESVPPCTLADVASYNAKSNTLTMNFTVGNQSAVKWNAWLTSGINITGLFSVSQPITNPPKAITKTTVLSPAGTVGVLSTLTTPTNGIICSSFVTVNTGTP